jgi:hypothetical protein
MAARYATQDFWYTPVLAAPSTLAASPNVGGGTFANAAYFWKITGLNGNGETTGSNEATCTVATNGTASLTWAALPAGTTGVKVYRGTVTNTENVLVATLGAVVAYTDTGTVGVAATVPALNTAPLASVFVEEGALRDSVTSPEVVANASLFGTVAPVVGQATGHMTGRRAQHLAQYPAGSQL